MATLPEQRLITIKSWPSALTLGGHKGHLTPVGGCQLSVSVISSWGHIDLYANGTSAISPQNQFSYFFTRFSVCSQKEKDRKITPAPLLYHIREDAPLSWQTPPLHEVWLTSQSSQDGLTPYFPRVVDTDDSLGETWHSVELVEDLTIFCVEKSQLSSPKPPIAQNCLPAFTTLVSQHLPGSWAGICHGDFYCQYIGDVIESHILNNFPGRLLTHQRYQAIRSQSHEGCFAIVTWLSPQPVQRRARFYPDSSGTKCRHWSPYPEGLGRDLDGWSSIRFALDPLHQPA